MVYCEILTKTILITKISVFQLVSPACSHSPQTFVQQTQDLDETYKTMLKEN